MPHEKKPLLGLIVNPVAGLGGRVGLGGSDGPEIAARALALGAVPRASERAAMALSRLGECPVPFALWTGPGALGEEAARQAGLSCRVLSRPHSGATTPADTVALARQMAAGGVDLLVFAGGDGTARDVLDAVGLGTPVLGIPAGVKIHSPVYAVTPVAAGEIIRRFLAGNISLQNTEVMDIDEAAFRAGQMKTRFYGYLSVPQSRGLQGPKVSVATGAEALAGIGREMAERMQAGQAYAVGPGTTTQAVTRALGLSGALLGVDVVMDGALVAGNAGERELLALGARHPLHVVVTPIGGQGHIFGRGNQQISPDVLGGVPRENIHIVATREKLASIRAGHLVADTGSPALNAALGGYWRVVTGYQDYTVMKVLEEP